uniref:Uncharacterized protein n=1 Tax=Anopheles farauti TaxID=69004 RepID=A0A182QHC2_9DIPT
MEMSSGCVGIAAVLLLPGGILALAHCRRMMMVMMVQVIVFATVLARCGRLVRVLGVFVTPYRHRTTVHVRVRCNRIVPVGDSGRTGRTGGGSGGGRVGGASVNRTTSTARV